MAACAQFDLSPRTRERMRIVVDALNAQFGWHLPEQGSVLPGFVRGGHYNVFFTHEGDCGAFRAVFDSPADRIFPPGCRIPARLPGLEGVWALHIPNAAIRPGYVTGHAHLDRGDPDRDVAGIFTHVGFDFLWSHLFGHRDLDPKRY